MSRDELIVVVRRQADQITAQDQQITAMAGRLAELMEANEALAAKLAQLEHLLSRNSGNSSSPEPAGHSKEANSSNAPTRPNQEGINKSRDTPIHRLRSWHAEAHRLCLDVPRRVLRRSR